MLALAGFVEVEYPHVVQQGLYCNNPTLHGRENLVAYFDLPPFFLKGVLLAFWRELSGMLFPRWEMRPTTEGTTLVQLASAEPLWQLVKEPV